MMHAKGFILAAASSVLSIAYATDYPSYSQDFTIINGQIHTPGHVIINSPQPWTPMGGDSLHISLDITANGNIPLPPYADDAENKIHSIAIYLTSQITGLNLTITDPSFLSGFDLEPSYLQNYTGFYNDTLVMWQEPGSTVKHVNFRWPKCFAEVEEKYEYRGGMPVGAYNISLHQSSLIKGVEHFSVFNLPIIVKDDIPTDGADRFTCFMLQSGAPGGEAWRGKWNNGEQGEGMSWEEYPWVEGTQAERVSVQSKNVEGEGFVTWPESESAEETIGREEREALYGYYNKAEEGAKTTATGGSGAESKGSRQMAAVSVAGMLGAAAAATVWVMLL